MKYEAATHGGLKESVEAARDGTSIQAQYGVGNF